MNKLILILFSYAALAQIQPKQSLLVVSVPAMTTTYSAECGGVTDCLDNRSITLRFSNYHSVSATGTGTWQVQIQYANGSPSGFTSCGSAATINQASNPAIAYCNGYYDYILISISGANASTVLANYTGQNQLYLSNAVGSVSFPISLTQGGTGATTPAVASVNLGIAELNPANYNFASQTCNSSNICSPGGSPGASLNSGVSATVTLTPCPFGVAGTHIIASSLPHLLWISSGTGGAAEAVAITGGTCAGDGATAGTISFTPANNHSGSWTIQSNTTGVQECVYVAGATGSCRMPATSPTNLWGNVSGAAALTVPSGYGVSLRGQGPSSTFVRLKGTTGNWINYIGNGYLDLGDFQMVDDTNTTHTSGSFIAIGAMAGGLMNNVFANHCYDCVDAVGVNGNTHFQSLNLYGIHVGFYVTGSSSTEEFSISDSTIHGDANGLRVENTTVAGMYLSNNLFDQVNTYGSALSTGASMSLRAGTNLPMNEVVLHGNDFEGVGTGVELVGNSGTNSSNDISLTGGRISTTWCGLCEYSGWEHLVMTGVAVNVSVGTSPVTTPVAAIMLSNVMNYSISSNTIFAPSVPVGIDYSSTGDNVGKIMGNSILNIDTGGYPTEGMSITNAANVQIENNNFGGPATPFFLGSGVTNLRMSGNIGVDDVIPAVSSASTLAFPVNPVITVSGSTNFTAVTFPLIAGSRGAMTATAATITATAGASIGNSFIFRQNVPASWYWDGTKIWFSGQDPGLSNTHNYIATEGGANNAITGTLTGVATGDGLCVSIQLAHTLQAGANTFALNGGSAVAIKSAKNTANNIAAGWAATGRPLLCYSSTLPVWLDMSQ